MGISTVKGNGGFLGTDARRFITSSGVISQRKARIERLDGKLGPVYPTSFIFEDDFSSNDLSKWTVKNDGSSRSWIVTSGAVIKSTGGSTVAVPSGSTYAACVSNDGTNNTYSNYTEIHMYFDVDIPSGTSSLTLTFDWMCKGENQSGNSNYDFGYIMFADPSSFTPAAGTNYGLSGTGYERIIGTNNSAFNTNNGKFNCEDNGSNPRCPTTLSPNTTEAFLSDNITIDSSEITTGTLWQTGVTRRIVFSFKSDVSANLNPSWTVANIKLAAN